MVGRAVEGTAGQMYLYIPTTQLDAELAILSAFMHVGALHASLADDLCMLAEKVHHVE
jgi:hypothetical protein